MHDNTTSANVLANSTVTASEEDQIKLRIYIIMKWIGIAFTLTAFLYAVISWCVLKKFRHFKNYVLVNAIVANVLRFTLLEMGSLSPLELREKKAVLFVYWSLMYYFLLVNHCWLLVMCYIFYFEFVKVFRLNIRRRFFKSTLFAWCAPFIVILIIFLGFLTNFFLNSDVDTKLIDFWIASTVVLCVPVSLNFIIYIIVVYSLFRSSPIVAGTTFNKCHRFYIATLIFIFSNITLFCYLLRVFKVPLTVDIIMRILVEYLNTLVVDIYIFLLKNNRELWHEFLHRKYYVKKMIEMK